MEKQVKKIIIGIVSVIILIFLATYAGKLMEDVQANEIVVIQDPIDGELHVYIGGTVEGGGLVAQNFGKATHYKKSFQYWFDGADTEGHFATIPTKFYDGGHASIPGSIRVDLPLDAESIKKIHMKFGSQEAIETQLVGQVLIKAITMSGPLMTSKESYAEKKNNLVYYIEDQASEGIYKTTQKEVKIKDALTGEEKVMTAVEVLNDSKGLPLRQEKSLIIENNIRLNNLSLGDFAYDDIVKKQIAAQQDQTMRVQTGIANAKRAEQDAITVKQQGIADAAKAEWEQKTINAKIVAEAEGRKLAAIQDVLAAEQEKKANILRGEGEGAYKRAVMAGNGALDQKLATYEKVQKYWADALAGYKGNITPLYQTGGASSNAAVSFMEIMSAKAAKDLSLDLSNKK